MRLLALLPLLAATEAGALSCLPPDPAASFQTANEAAEVYVVLHGTVTFDATWPGRGLAGDGPAEDQLVRIDGRIEGAGLAADGSFGNAVSGPVVLAESCAGPWCGSIPSGAEVLAFAEVGEDGVPVITLDPCGSLTFVDPTPEMLETVGACARGACPDAG